LLIQGTSYENTDVRTSTDIPIVLQKGWVVKSGTSKERQTAATGAAVKAVPPVWLGF